MGKNGEDISSDELLELFGEDTVDYPTEDEQALQEAEEQKQNDPNYQQEVEAYSQRAEEVLLSGRGHNQLELEQLAGIDPRLGAKNKWFRWMQEADVYEWDEIYPLIPTVF